MYFSRTSALGVGLCFLCGWCLSYHRYLTLSMINHNNHLSKLLTRPSLRRKFAGYQPTQINHLSNYLNWLSISSANPLHFRFIFPMRLDWSFWPFILSIDIERNTSNIRFRLFKRMDLLWSRRGFLLVKGLRKWDLRIRK